MEKYLSHILNEEELLYRLSDRDESALKELITIYFPVLCGFAEKFLPDSSLAKDVVQETFIKFWRADQTFHSFNALKGYLFVSTKNGCLNLIRGRGRQENRDLAAFRAGQELTDTELTEIVYAENIALMYQVVQGMSPAMQKVFYLSYSEGMTVKQIAARLDMNLKTVKNHKYKVLTVLRRRFGKKDISFFVFISLLIN